MAGNLFDNPTMSMMYEDALQSLYNGCVMPWERDLLAEAPLPADMVDPFAQEDVKPLSVMNLTYVSLSGWIADAKKEKYYSERFVQLSRLVMKGVSTMARGLVTLHIRGEELSAAPMQIDDLISVGSYHFRKSYLGVVQFSSKHPEIGERLLVNQLGWATILMRLFKTKDKINSECGMRNSELPENKKSEIRNKISETAEEGRLEKEGLLDGNSDNSAFCTPNSELTDGFDPLPALSAPGGFGPLKAYGPLKGCQTGNKKSEAHGGQSPVQASLQQETVPRVASLPENEEGRSKNEETQSNAECGTTGNKKSEIRNKKSDSLENEEVRSKNEENEIEGREISEIESSEPDEHHKNEKSETFENEEGSIQNEDIPAADHRPLTTDSESSFLLHNSSKGKSSEFRTPHSELRAPPPEN